MFDLVELHNEVMKEIVATEQVDGEVCSEEHVQVEPVSPKFDVEMPWIHDRLSADSPHRQAGRSVYWDAEVIRDLDVENAEVGPGINDGSCCQSLVATDGHHIEGRLEPATDG